MARAGHGVRDFHHQQRNIREAIDFRIAVVDT
jgi:hypothetical protein